MTLTAVNPARDIQQLANLVHLRQPVVAAFRHGKLNGHGSQQLHVLAPPGLGGKSNCSFTMARVPLPRDGAPVVDEGKDAGQAHERKVVP